MRIKGLLGAALAVALSARAPLRAQAPTCTALTAESCYYMSPGAAKDAPLLLYSVDRGQGDASSAVQKAFVLCGLGGVADTFKAIVLVSASGPLTSTIETHLLIPQLAMKGLSFGKTIPRQAKCATFQNYQQTQAYQRKGVKWEDRKIDGIKQIKNPFEYKPDAGGLSVVDRFPVKTRTTKGAVGYTGDAGWQTLKTLDLSALPKDDEGFQPDLSQRQPGESWWDYKGRVNRRNLEFFKSRASELDKQDGAWPAAKKYGYKFMAFCSGAGDNIFHKNTKQLEEPLPDDAAALDKASRYTALFYRNFTPVGGVSLIHQMKGDEEFSLSNTGWAVASIIPGVGTVKGTAKVVKGTKGLVETGKTVHAVRTLSEAEKIARAAELKNLLGQADRISSVREALSAAKETRTLNRIQNAIDWEKSIKTEIEALRASGKIGTKTFSAAMAKRAVELQESAVQLRKAGNAEEAARLEALAKKVWSASSADRSAIQELSR